MSRQFTDFGKKMIQFNRMMAKIDSENVKKKVEFHKNKINKENKKNGK